MGLIQYYRRATHRPIKLYWWRYKPELTNFGDEITPYIINKVFGYKTTWSPPPDCDMAGAGSIIEILQREANGNSISVWGSGFIKPGPANTKQNLHFAAVRGNLSLKRVTGKSIALGDPALLLPMAIKPSRQKKYRLGIIPHYVDREAPVIKDTARENKSKLINIFDSAETIVKDITACEFIVSSSLHGLIASDAYGIPNRWMPFSNKLTGSSHKFEDYYSVFNKKPDPIKPAELDKNFESLINDYQQPPGVKDIQSALVKAFPF